MNWVYNLVTGLIGLLSDFASAISPIGWQLVALMAILAFRKPLTAILTNFRQLSVGNLSITTESQRRVSGPDQSLGGGLPTHLPEPPSYLATQITSLKSQLDDLEPSDQFRREEIMLRALATSQYNAYFEVIYSQIFGSQQEALEYLHRTGETSIVIFYERHKVKHEELASRDATVSPAPLSFQQWLRYLTDANLVEFADGKAKVTELGQSFIEYVTARNYTSTRDL